MFIFTEENIGNIKNAVYSTDGMKDKHAKKIEYSKTKGLFKDFNMSKYFDRKPPKNTSIKTYQELMYLKDLPEDLEYVKQHDTIEENDNILIPPNLIKALQLYVAGSFITNINGKDHSIKGDKYLGLYLRELKEDIIDNNSNTSEIDTDNRFTNRGFV